MEDQFDPGSLELEIKLTNHKFGFGSLVNDKILLDPEFAAYRTLFYEFFNWATVQSYKWKFNQGTWVRFLELHIGKISRTAHG